MQVNKRRRVGDDVVATPSACRAPLYNSVSHIYATNRRVQTRSSAQAVRRMRPVRRENAALHHLASSYAVGTSTLQHGGAAVPLDDDGGGATVLPGERKLHTFEDLLENAFIFEGKPLRRSPFQRDFCDVCIRAMAPNIVGSDWSKVSQKIMQMHGWRDVKKFGAASAPRRFGKSVMLSVLIVLYAMIVPKSRQCVFSTGGRASTNDLEIMTQFLRDINLSHWIHRKNQEFIWLMPDPERPDDVRKIYCYPSNEKISTLPRRTHSSRRRRRRHVGCFLLWPETRVTSRCARCKVRTRSGSGFCEMRCSVSSEEKYHTPRRARVCPV